MLHDGQDASRSSWIAVGIEFITRAACRWPAATLWLVFASTIACSAYAWTTLTIKTDRSDLINPDSPYQRRWRHYADAFDDVTEDLVVVVEAPRREEVIRVVNDLGPQLVDDSQNFRNVLYRIDLRKLAAKGLQFLPTEELQKLGQKLRRFRLMATVVPNSTLERQMSSEAQAQAAATADIFAQLEQLLGAWKNWSHLPPEQKAVIQQQTAELVDQLASSEAAAEVSPAMAEGMSKDGGVRYLLNAAGTMGFIQAQPVVDPGDLNGATRSIERMRTLIAEVQKQHPKATIGLTGVPVLEHDEMQQSQSEMTEASVLSFLGVGLLLVAGFRRMRHPVIGMLMLLVGTAWSFAAAAIVVGHLNILSIAFAAMLFGLGNDFAIVYISHYADQRDRGMSVFDAVLDASRSVGPGITTAAATAAAAFYAAALTDFSGIAELGLIAGWGLVLCNLLTFIFVPPALLVWDRDWDLTGPVPEPPPLRYRRPVAVAVLVVFCGTVVWLGREATHVHYDTNLLNMQARGTEAVRAQERIQEKSDDSLLYAVSLAKNRQTALALKQRYEKLPTVSRVEEIASLFPPAPTAERTELIAGIARAATMLAQIHPASPNPGKIGEALDEVYTAIVNTQDPAVAATAQQLNTFLDRLSSLPLNEQVAALTPGGAAAAQLESVANTDPAPVTLKDLPASFTSRFVSHDKQWLLKIYPRDAVWEGAPLKKFVEEVRTVDPEVTGTPLQNYEASQSIWNSYLQAGLYALIAVLILLVWDFRTVHETLLAISPAGIALLVTLGVLGQWNIPLNPANMIMLPLLLGLGVDGGVHVLHDYRAQVGGYSISRSTARSLFLTAMTSIVGFGSLMVASHRGLFSLGFVLTVGVTAALVTSLVALPALLTLVTPGLPPAVSAAAPPVLEEAEHDSEAIKWRQPA